jgi:peptidoglycan hydrolase-like protein with peptidoglycan-binding domain
LILGKRLAFVVLPLVVGCLVAAAPVSKKKPSTKSTAKKTAAKKSSTKKSASKKTATKKTAPSWRNTQRTPAPERYREIQQALATKGYLGQNAPSGVWDTSSIAALKKFQADQNLEPSGKIDSLSLIALGLGPRRDQPPGQP